MGAGCEAIPEQGGCWGGDTKARGKGDRQLGGGSSGACWENNKLLRPVVAEAAQCL
uniref:Uncharacterized protein n=1 Tax=Ustilago esculenta TaxID=185366 RepID=A0A481SFB5_9BASI|nr:hypothetical protein UE_1352 [Ustilago esculenta]